MKLRPLGDRVLVERTEALSRTPGGIWIPDQAKDAPNQGVVKAVGEGRFMPDGTIKPIGVKAGDKVLFGKYAGTEVEVGDDKFMMMGADDLLGVVEED